MRILTWNINGLRSVVARFGTLKSLLESLTADIICFQEIKTRRSEIERELALFQGWESFFTFSPSKPGPGYSGVATFCRTATASTPIAVEQGLTGCHLANAAGSQPSDTSNSSNHSSKDSSIPLLLCEDLGLDMQQLQTLDSEGRALITDHGLFVLVNLYGPALTSEERAEERLGFKLNLYKVLEWRIRRWVASGRQVIVVGDLNISPAPIDCCDPHPIPQFLLRPDRVWLNKLLGPDGPGVTDVFRCFHPTRAQAYTCWSTATGARINNYGTRIDHILAAGQMAKCVAAPTPAEVVGLRTVDGNRGRAAEAAAQTATDHVQDLPLSAAVAVQSQPAPASAAGITDASNPPAASMNIISGCDIEVDFVGSDHAPVWVDLTVSSQHLPAGNAKTLPGSGSSIFTGRQVSLKGWLVQKQQQPRKPMQEVAAQQQVTQPQQMQPLPQQPLQQQQVDMQQTGGLPCFQGQSSSSISGRAVVNSVKRKGMGLPQIGSGKRLAGQTSLLGYMKEPRIAAGSDSHSQGTDSGTSAVNTAAAAWGVLPARGGSWPKSQLSTLTHHIQAAGGSVQQASRANSGNTLEALRMQPPQHLQQQTMSTLQQEAATGSAAAVYCQQAPDDRQQQARAAWQQISRAMQPPLCKVHKEVCVIRTVKKKGSNFGRQFYVCARADGPPPVGRCDYFEWAGGEKKVKGSK